MSYFIILIFITLLVLAYSKFFKEKETVQIEPNKEKVEVYSSNIIKNVIFLIFMNLFYQ